MKTDWVKTVLANQPAAEVWASLFDGLGNVAQDTPDDLNAIGQQVDELLINSAWDLWTAYPADAPHTSQALIRWWEQSSTVGRAVLILDALSLRELPHLLSGAQAHNIAITWRVTGAEAPSDTNHFARALGVASRATLANGTPPKAFALKGPVESAVLSMPFADCRPPLATNVFVWHSWLDDLLEQYPRSTGHLHRATPELAQPEFWNFVNHLRQGRRLVITADHGHAFSRGFITLPKNSPEATALRESFGAKRNIAAQGAWPYRFMPPLVFTANGQHMVVGPYKWDVAGGFPFLTHGGLSLLEIAVPFIELPAL